MLVFELTVESAREFYKRCMRQDANTEDERTQILIDMAEEGLVNSVSHTNRTRDQYVQDMKKHFNILDVGYKHDGD